MGSRSVSAKSSLTAQQRVRLSRVGQFGQFRRFARDEIEHSIVTRFERQVAQYPDHIAVNTSNPRLEKQGRKRVSNAPRLSGMLTLRGIGGTLLQWWCCMHHQCSAQFHQTPGRRAEETAKNSIPSATDSQDGLDGLPVEWNRRTSHIVTKLRETAKVEVNTS